MTENQTIKELLIAFISYLHLGQGKFEKECGLANGYVNNIRKSITPEKLQQIALRYPELNTGWLMTGEGEMLRPEQNVSDVSGSTVVGANVNGNGNNISNNDASNIAGMIELQKGYQDMMKKSQEQIDRLLAVIERLTLKTE